MERGEDMTLVLAHRRALLLALLLLALLMVALLTSGMLLHAAHTTSVHLFADSSTPDVIIHNH
jgi:cytochrome c biogenesis factor